MLSAAVAITERYGGSVEVVLKKESASVPAPDDFIQELLTSADLVLTGTGD